MKSEYLCELIYVCVYLKYGEIIFHFVKKIDYFIKFSSTLYAIYICHWLFVKIQSLYKEPL